MTDLLHPIKPYDLDKKMRRGLERIVERVTGAAVIHNLGRDLLLLIYMAGFSHGTTVANEARDSGRLPQGEDSRSEAECEASQSGESDSERIAQTTSPPPHGASL